MLSNRTKEYLKIALGDAAAATNLIDSIEESTNLPEIDPFSLKSANNLSDLEDVSEARDNLSLGESDSPTFSGLQLNGPAEYEVSSGQTTDVVLFKRTDSAAISSIAVANATHDKTVFVSLDVIADSDSITDNLYAYTSRLSIVSLSYYPQGNSYQLHLYQEGAVTPSRLSLSNEVVGVGIAEINIFENMDIAISPGPGGVLLLNADTRVADGKGLEFLSTGNPKARLFNDWNDTGESILLVGETGEGAFFGLKPFDADGTDFVGIDLLPFWTNGGADAETLGIYYDPNGTPSFQIGTDSGGLGTPRMLEISAKAEGVQGGRIKLYPGDSGNLELESGINGFTQISGQELRLNGNLSGTFTIRMADVGSQGTDLQILGCTPSTGNGSNIVIIAGDAGAGLGDGPGQVAIKAGAGSTTSILNDTTGVPVLQVSGNNVAVLGNLSVTDSVLFPGNSVNYSMSVDDTLDTLGIRPTSVGEGLYFHFEPAAPHDGTIDAWVEIYSSFANDWSTFGYLGVGYYPSSGSYHITASGDAPASYKDISIGINYEAALTIDVDKNVAVGTAALATNATDGFLYIPTSAGAPVGTPTSKPGLVPLHYDASNEDLYVYNGAWRKVTLT